jgi:hypothetical protein
MKNINLPITLNVPFHPNFMNAVDNVHLFYNDMCERNKTITENTIVNCTNGNVVIIFKGDEFEANAVCEYINGFVKRRE